MNSLLDEELKKTDFTNLHETIFAYDPATDSETTTDYLDANKIGHMVQQAPKIDQLSIKFLKFLQKGSKTSSRPRYYRQTKPSHSVYSYEQSQRTLNPDQSTFQAVDRTVIYNKFTSNAVEAATASVSFTTASHASKVAREKNALFDKLADLANKKIRVHQTAAVHEAAAAPESAKYPVFNLPEDLDTLVQSTRVISLELNKVEVNLKLPWHILSAKSDQETNQIIDMAVEEFKTSICNSGLKREQKNKRRLVRETRVLRKVLSFFYSVFSIFFFIFIIYL